MGKERIFRNGSNLEREPGVDAVINASVVLGQIERDCGSRFPESIRRSSALSNGDETARTVTMQNSFIANAIIALR